MEKGVIENVRKDALLDWRSLHKFSNRNKKESLDGPSMNL